MIRSFLLFAGLGLSLATVDQAAAQTTGGAQSRPRFFNPFLVRYSRLQINPFGLPSSRTTGTGAIVRSGSTASAPLIAAANPTTSTSAKVAKDDEIPQAAVTRPTYRPPVRSPYRPPPRPPF